MSGNVFFVFNKKDYFYESESQCIRPYRFGDRVMHPVFAVCEKSHIKKLPEIFINKEALTTGKTIITDSVFKPPLFGTLQKQIRRENMFLYYMNPVSQKTAGYMQYFMSGHIYTYDPEEAQRYGIKYKHLPYSEKMFLEKAKPVYDAFFLGMEKGRSEQVREAVNLMEANGLHPKVMLCGSNDNRYQMQRYIRYEEYLQYLAGSKTILEINAEGQTSCTLRFLESLFFHKKLLTNNAHITEDPYYEAANVFILGVDDPATLKEFVTQPYEETHQDLSGLMFKNWMQDW